MELRQTDRPTPIPSPRETLLGEVATVLVVEDDATLRSTLVYNLRREGYRVLQAHDGETAVRLAISSGERPDLVLLDVMLPGIDGFAVLRKLRSRLDVPVLMVSARGEAQDRIDGLELGADDYILKPFVLRELLARVRAGIRRRAVPAAKPPSVLYRGVMRIELDRQRVFVGEDEVLLRPKEYALLSTMAMQPGRVFSRQELLDEIWGEQMILGQRNVDVHLSWLRGKLRDAGLDETPIETVYGTGYRFTSPEAATG